MGPYIFHQFLIHFIEYPAGLRRRILVCQYRSVVYEGEATDRGPGSLADVEYLRSEEKKEYRGKSRALRNPRANPYTLGDVITQL